MRTTFYRKIIAAIHKHQSSFWAGCALIFVELILLLIWLYNPSKNAWAEPLIQFLPIFAALCGIPTIKELFKACPLIVVLPDNYEHSNNNKMPYESRVIFTKDTSKTLIEQNNPECQVLLAQRIIRLDLQVTNFGTAPANDIDIVVYLPNQLKNRIYNEEKLRQRWDMPDILEEGKIEEYFLKSVSRPATMEQFAEKISRDLKADADFMGFKRIIAQQRSTSDTSNTPIKAVIGNNTVRYHIPTIKQNMPLLLESFFIIFGSFADMVSFEISYEVNVAELPINEKGEINVIINREGWGQ